MKNQFGENDTDIQSRHHNNSFKIIKYLRISRTTSLQTLHVLVVGYTLPSSTTSFPYKQSIKFFGLVSDILFLHNVMTIYSKDEDLILLHPGIVLNSIVYNTIAD